MASTIGKLIESLPARLMSTWVRPDVLPKAPAELLDPALPTLYVLELGGLADRTALNMVCARLGLPHPGDPLHYEDTREGSAVDVLQRRRGGWFGRRRSIVSRRLERLVATALRPGADGSAAAGDLQICPVAIYWGRAPDLDTGVVSLATGENWDIGGRVSKLVATVVHGRNTLVRFSEPLSLSQLVASGPGHAAALDPERTAELLTRKLSRILRVHFRQRRIATLGPDRSHRRTVIGRVLADEAVRRAIAAEHASSGRSVARLARRAENDALEIAADVSYPTIRLLDRLLTKLWTELYDGIELSGIERLHAVADGHEIVYVPCHRSHIDYLLLSWLMVKEGFSLPHVAAGVNLNLPVVGGILRRGGAFFLRRTFAGDPVYAAVFASYLKTILQRGHAIEYFIEGGRSRTGRLLPAKGGMLAMTAHAYLRQPRVPVVFVPVYFGYERLIEGRSFTKELTGGKKRNESVTGLLRSLRRLRDDYGRVHVGIGEPLMLDALLDRHRPRWRDEHVDAERPAWLVPIVNELGEEILRRINGAASVTPIALLATVMLATGRGRLGTDELHRQLSLYASLLRSTHADTHVVVPTIEPAAVVRHGIELGYVETLVDDIGELVSLRDGQAPALTYFRNNVLHLLTLPAHDRGLVLEPRHARRGGAAQARRHRPAVPARRALRGRGSGQRGGGPGRPGARGARPAAPPPRGLATRRRRYAGGRLAAAARRGRAAERRALLPLRRAARARRGSARARGAREPLRGLRPTARGHRGPGRAGPARPAHVQGAHRAAVRARLRARRRRRAGRRRIARHARDRGATAAGRRHPPRHPARLARLHLGTRAGRHRSVAARGPGRGGPMLAARP